MQATIPTKSISIFKHLLLLVLVYRSFSYLQTLLNSQIVLTNYRASNFFALACCMKRTQYFFSGHAGSIRSVNITKTQLVSRRDLTWFSCSRNKCICKKPYKFDLQWVLVIFYSFNLIKILVALLSGQANFHSWIRSQIFIFIGFQELDKHTVHLSNNNFSFPFFFLSLSFQKFF